MRWLVFVVLIFCCSGVFAVSGVVPSNYEVDIELDLKAPNANAGGIVNFSVEIFNQGEEDVAVSSSIQIFKDGSLIENISLGDVTVVAMTSVIVGSLFDSSGLFPGDYNSTVFVEYGSGEIVTDENPFRLGELFVKIVNYSREFREDKLERFNIEVESFYNYNVNDLYAEVNVIGVEDARFRTSTGELRAWRTKTIEGFLDTSDIDSEDFQAEIILHYGNETTSEVVDLKLILKYDYTFIFLLIGFFIVAGFLVWRIVVFMKRIRKKKKK